MSSYYQLLGIQQDHRQQNVPQAFRTKVKQVHPDKSLGSVDQREATIRLYEAYKVINDPEARKAYDQQLKYRQKTEEVGNSRYFEETTLIPEGGKWFAECEQCMGRTEIESVDQQKIRKGEKNFFVKCWHCNLTLSLFVE